MKLKVVFFILILHHLSLAAGLGVNISLPERGGTFVDLVKENYRWLDRSWKSLSASQVDAQGWPRVDAIYIYDGRPVAEWAGQIDDPEKYRIDLSGVYKCSFTGQALVSAEAGGAVLKLQYNPNDNRTTFDFYLAGPAGPEHGYFALSFTATKRSPDSRTGSGFTDFEMIRPGYNANNTQTFTDDFINTLTSVNFNAIRFMNFTGTNGSVPAYPKESLWADRKLPSDASQKSIPQIDKPEGAAWEYVIQLSNKVQMDVWINIQVSVTENYVYQLAKMLQSDLDPDLYIYVESSNEVWNTAPGFEQSRYNQAQAKALNIGEHENHARRTVQLAQIFADVFGSDALNNRIRVVLCSHKPMLKWWVGPMLQYIDDTFGPPSEYLYAIASQLYYGGGTEKGESVDRILDDCYAGITSQVNEIGGNQAGRKQWVLEARRWRLPGGYCSYEGGPDHGGGATENVANQIRAERHPRMAEIYKYNFDDCFWQLGANLAMQFTLSSAYNRYGCWGLTDDIAEPDRNHKFQAVRDLVGERSRDPDGGGVPEGYRLYQNYPNPFNKETTIKYGLPEAGHVNISLYNVMGKKITVLVDGWRKAGYHSVPLKDPDLASGVYFYRMKSNNFSRTQKGVIVR